MFAGYSFYQSNNVTKKSNKCYNEFRAYIIEKYQTHVLDKNFCDDYNTILISKITDLYRKLFFYPILENLPGMNRQASSIIKTAKAEQTYSFRKRLKVCVDVTTLRRDKIVN